MSNDTQGYLLTSGNPEMQRLRLQAQVWHPAAEEFLGRLGIRQGSRAIDLGCGAIGVLKPLSDLVGPEGQVIGLDGDAIQLRAAGEFVSESGLTNVTILQGDAFHTGFADNEFDVVHIRFLFAPVGRDAELLAEALRILRPGGVIAIQEPDSSSWNAAPLNPAWRTLKSEILSAFKAAGGDFDAGCRTFAMLRAAGLEDVSQTNAVLALTGSHPYKRLPVQFAGSLRRRILDGGRLSEAELDALVAEVARVAEDPATVITTFVLTQVAGRKR